MELAFLPLITALMVERLNFKKKLSYFAKSILIVDSYTSSLNCKWEVNFLIGIQSFLPQYRSVDAFSKGTREVV